MGSEKSENLPPPLGGAYAEFATGRDPLDFFLVWVCVYGGVVAVNHFRSENGSQNPSGGAPICAIWLVGGAAICAGRKIDIQSRVRNPRFRIQNQTRNGWEIAIRPTKKRAD